MKGAKTQRFTRSHRQLLGGVLAALFMLTATACSAHEAAKAREETMARWQEVDRLVDEQKYEAASEVVLEILGQARDAGDEAGLTRALIKATQLRLALHGYERAVRFLQDEAWPEGPRHRLAMGLFYGQTLATYLRSYSWQIRQREEVTGAAGESLESWTLRRLVAEIEKSYAEVFSAREAWGESPIGDLSAYIDPGNYPAHIRGSLRDIVSYLWTDLLADTSLWPPGASNEIYRLDLEALLAPSEGILGGKASEFEASAHPLEKIHWILADLEAWHLGRNQPEAALEARLSLLRHLNGSFATHAGDRTLIRGNLRQRLADFDRSLPWYAMGVSLLAEMQRDESEDPMGRAKARETAQQGLRLHPESVGGQRCRHLVERLETPQLSLASMATDGASKRSIEITHANVDSVYFRAWPVDVLSRLLSREPRWQPKQQDVEKLLGTKPVAAWSRDLPATPDLQPHRTFVTPPALDPGAYVIAASMRQDFKGQQNSRAATLFIRSDLVLSLTMLQDELAWEITTQDGRVGAPVQAEIEIVRVDWRAGGARVAQGTAAEDGSLRFGAEKWNRNQHVAVGRWQQPDGEHIAISQIYGRPYPRQPNAQRSSLIYTDRSVYRPGQEILFKVVAFAGQESDFETQGDEKIQVWLTDSNGEQVEALDLVTNEFGSASGRLSIPPGRLLGSWSLASSWNGYANVQVEEYKRPSFEVELEEPTSAMRLNEPATVIGRADYYFGLPVSAGSARWRVSREPYFPPWRWWFRPPSAPPRVIAHGESQVGADGTFEIVFTPEADERLSADRDVSYRYRVHAEVTDDGGETREASRSVRVGFASIEAEIEMAASFGRHGQATEIVINRRRLDGAAVAGRGQYRVTRIEEPAQTPLPADIPTEPPSIEGALRTEGDGLRPRWQTAIDAKQVLRFLAEKGEGESVSAGSVEHNEKGEASLSLELPGGAFRLHYETVDDFGQKIERHLDFIVKGEAPIGLPLLLRADRKVVEVGETLELLVHSGFEGQRLLFEVFHEDRRLLRRELEATRAPQIVEVPITANERGGFGIALTAVRDHQLMRLTESIEVPWSDRRLELAFERFRDRLTPGTNETFSVVVHGRGEDGEMDAAVDPATLELLAYMYDRSLDLFAEHDPPRPLALFPRRVSLPGLTTNLGPGPTLWQRYNLASAIAYPQLRAGYLRFLEGWPIGGPGRRGGPARLQTMTARSPMAMMKARPVGEAPMAAAAEAADMAFDAVEETVAVASVAAPPSGADDGAGEDADSEPIRSDFAETAFWLPHLRFDEGGSVRFEFTVPDSVTEWSVWAHALTRDFRSGQVMKTTRSVKDLLIRPYVPRFLREGDRAELRLVVSNAGQEDFAGSVDVTIEDPESGADLLAAFGLQPSDVSDLPFTVAAGATSTLTVPLEAPRSPRPVSLTARARAGELSDGERRPLPILPSRLHLAQSRFKALQGPVSRVLRFDDLAADEDPSLETESLVVTLDGQLFGSVLRALPYLVDYPYQCTEQTLNRYLSTGILAGLFERYPSVAELGARLASERDTPLEPWQEEDANRRLLLEETPWLRHARGGENKDGLLKVLDPEVAEKIRAKSLVELREIQLPGGGFPWWPGGPPSPYMTFYALQGFARGLEFGLDVPKDMTVSAWGYLQKYWQEELSRKLDQEPKCCAPQLTFFAWLLWAYPDSSWTGNVFTDEDRRRILDQAAAEWKVLSPRLKGYLALALTRAGEGERAESVWDSVMDSAKNDEDLGTYWAPEERAWLWYNDTVETQAFALRVLMTLGPEDPRRHGLVQWLLLDKKLGHWKSTRATAEAVYSLAAYLAAEGTLDAEQRATVELGARRQSFVFEPQEDGRRQLVIEGAEVESSMASIAVENETKGLLFASATWHFATDQLPKEARGDFFTVERRFFRRVLDGEQWRLEPLAEGARVEVGDQLEVKLRIRSKHAAEYVHLRDPRGAGFEPEDTSSGYSWDMGLGHFREIRDSSVNYFFEWLPAGEYDFRYRLRAATAGTFRVAPAQMQSMYAPEFVAYSSGKELMIDGESAAASN